MNFRIPSWVWWGTAVLILSGAVVQLWQRPREVTVTRTVTETKTDEHTKQQVDLLTRALVESQQRQQSTEQKLADVATNQRETIYRGNSTEVAALLAQLNSRQAPTAPAPVINVMPASPSAAPSSSPDLSPASAGVEPISPSPMPVATGPQQVEVIVRSSETVDKSRTERTASSDASSKTDASADQRTTNDIHTVTDTKTDASTKTVTGGSSGERVARLGVGVTSARQPFASYDFTQFHLGPKQFGLGKLNAGIFLTRSPSVGIDGGPQVNVQPGKGRLFIMGGFQIREQTPVLGVGFKF